MALTFITGAVRSGKSRFARTLAEKHGGAVIYLATARPDPNDPEWVARIARHRGERPAHWRTLETAGDPPVDLADAIVRAGASELLLVDSLGTWLAAEMREGVRLDDLLERGAALDRALRAMHCSAILVSEETGWGIVPEHRSGRIFRDALGLLNQRFAHLADAAYLAVSGYALDLKAGKPIQ